MGDISSVHRRRTEREEARKQPTEATSLRIDAFPVESPEISENITELLEFSLKKLFSLYNGRTETGAERDRRNKNLRTS